MPAGEGLSLLRRRFRITATMRIVPLSPVARNERARKMKWFRFHTEVLDDPKVQRLNATVFRFWVNLLCLAASADGAIPTVDDVAFRLRMSTHDAGQYLDELILAGLVDIQPDGSRMIHNWSRRQYRSDNSTERVRRHRARLRANGGDETRGNANETLQQPTDRRRKRLLRHENEPRNVSETAPDTDSREEESYLELSLTPRASAASAENVDELGSRGGGWLPGPRDVSVDARRMVARELGIADADPLVDRYRRWPPSRTAYDTDAHFIKSARTIFANAPSTVRAACGVIEPETVEIKLPTAGASAAVRNSRLVRST